MPLKRRKFFGLSLAGFAGLSLPQWFQSRTRAAAAASPGTAPGKIEELKETTYWQRTDSFDEKLKLLASAWQRRDFRLARALSQSIRNSVIQAEAEEESPGTPVSSSSQYQAVESLPVFWRKWALGWRYVKVLTAEETGAADRAGEPVEVLLGFPKQQVQSLTREIRVAQLKNGLLREIPSQVHSEVRRGNDRLARVLFMADSSSGGKQTFLVFYGNPDAELPEYPTDLIVTGEGFGLDIENQYYKAALSRQMGQIERLTFKREHGLELFSGGEGHGEPPGIDWAHDYVASGSFQKLRITLWDTCPDYEVIRGPLCTIVRRWGFPYSPVHPVFTPSRLNIEVEYRFYAGLPWFEKRCRMEAIKSFEAEALRDDEWVFSGRSFTGTVWMGRDGKLRLGEVDPQSQDDLWGVGFFNKDSKDSFVALFLEHRAEGLPELKHAGAPTFSYRWHGQLWSRYPLTGKQLPAGAVLREKNAYVMLPFTEVAGPAMIEKLRRELMNPLMVSQGDIPGGIDAKEPPGQLARPGEASDSPIPKAAIWAALRDCKDAQLYTADINVVELGLIYDIRVRDDVVTVFMTMPHRGRPRAGYFAHGSISVHPTLSLPIEERLLKMPGVRHVIVRQTWEPPWSSNQLTDEGRKKLGLVS